MKRLYLLLALLLAACTPLCAQQFASRPAPEDRCFISPAVERCIKETCARLSDPKLARMFRQCFPSTLDTTVKLHGADDTFVITGDIPALWLRDSGAQVWPYLRFCREDPQLAALVRGLLMRQFRCILIDPYANAFNLCPDSLSPNWAGDGTEMRPGVFERKYELNSLCYPLRLAHGYWRATGDTTAFDGLWLQTVRTVLYTMHTEQRADGTSPYTFLRVTDRMHDTQSNRGKGHPARPCGLIASSFRASDDGTLLPFLVPDNFMAVDALRRTAEILRTVNREWALADSCAALAGQVEAALREHAVVHTEKYGDIYAFEVDGYGNALLMDDANVPSLLALPYIAGVPLDAPVYQNTRRFVLSTDNPYFFRGAAGEGIGGPHVGLGYVWPMSIILRALTSTDEAEIRQCIETLKATDAGTGFMHEAFHQDDATDYTRPWFAWANTLFGELVLRFVENMD
ncbi:MAG: glycoside hydrolase family 125 protein [Bacteroidaceae bacterium]|nr:glycoside hydrolase family 125 protein [Bacteroidaceae bacterium]